MKKLIAAVLTLMLALSCLTCFAEGAKINKALEISDQFRQHSITSGQKFYIGNKTVYFHAGAGYTSQPQTASVKGKHHTRGADFYVLRSIKQNAGRAFYVDFAVACHLELRRGPNIHLRKPKCVIFSQFISHLNNKYEGR